MPARTPKCEAHSRPRCSLTATLDDSHGSALSHKKRHEEALRLLRRSLDARIELWGPDHPSVADSYTNLGVAYLAQGKYAQAHSYQQQALALYRKHFGQDSWRVGDALYNLGEVATHEEHYPEAARYYQQSLQIYEPLVGRATSTSSKTSWCWPKPW